MFFFAFIYKKVGVVVGVVGLGNRLRIKAEIALEHIYCDINEFYGSVTNVNCDFKVFTRYFMDSDFNIFMFSTREFFTIPRQFFIFRSIFDIPIIRDISLSVNKHVK